MWWGRNAKYVAGEKRTNDVCCPKLGHVTEFPKTVLFKYDQIDTNIFVDINKAIGHYLRNTLGSSSN